MNYPSPQLLVVLPVYNEEESITQVVREWFSTLDSHAPCFTLLALNDGSTDRTQEILESLRSQLGDRMEIISRPNRGHGQTCIEGYKIALDRKIRFILQIDSDGQSDPTHFTEFWALKDRFDVIYGKRSRSDGARRVLASAVLRLLLKLIAKADCVDANVPYRLMRAEPCDRMIRSIPNDVFLANVALAVALSRCQEIRQGIVPINFPPRMGGEPSVSFGKFASKGIQLFTQLNQAGLTRRQ